MEIKSSVASDEVRNLSRMAIGALALACLVGAGSAAADVTASGKPIVALAFDADTHTLIKAAPDALYRTTGDSNGWQPVHLPEAAKYGGIAAVAISARAPHALYVAGPQIGVLRSSDWGETWAAKGDGLSSKNVVALTVHTEQPATVYAYVAASGIFRSEDGGDHWRLMDAGPRDGILRFVHSNMPGSMQTGWLFAATAKGVGRSMDCFCGWRDAGALGRPVTAVAYDLREPKRVYAATANGLFVSDNGGEQWSPRRSPGRITALVATSDGLLIAAADPAVLFRSTDRGLTWRRADE